MANIRVDLDSPVYHGQSIIFKSPTDCSTVTGLKAYYPDGDSTASVTFQFADAHGNNVGGKNLFASDILVTVILDTTLSRAYVQNADTNAYLEAKFASLEDEVDKKAPIGLVYQTLDGGANLNALHTSILNQFKEMPESTTRIFVVSFSSSYSPFRGQITNLTIHKLSTTKGIIKAELHEAEVTDTPSMMMWNVVNNNALDEWEYNNPPMLVGAEYRTTERIKGKAVYKRLVDDILEYRLDGETEWQPYGNILGTAPDYTYGTEDLEAGVTPLETGKLHFVYE